MTGFRKLKRTRETGIATEREIMKKRRQGRWRTKLPGAGHNKGASRGAGIARRPHHSASRFGATIAERDAADMACLCRGDEEAMKRLILRHKAYIQRLVTRILGNEAEADDVVEEAFVRVYRYRRRYNSRRKFATWLYTIALNLARNQFRNRARRPEFIPLEALNEEELELEHIALKWNPSPDARLESEERLRELEAIIDDLPPQLRESLNLFALEEEHQAEIALELGCSRKAVEQRVYHARQRLRSEIDRILHPRDGFASIDAVNS